MLLAHLMISFQSSDFWHISIDQQTCYYCTTTAIFNSYDFSDWPILSRLWDVPQPAFYREPSKNAAHLAQLGKSSDGFLGSWVENENDLLHIWHIVRLTASQTKQLLLKKAENWVERLQVRNWRFYRQTRHRFRKQLIQRNLGNPFRCFDIIWTPVRMVLHY